MNPVTVLLTALGGLTAPLVSMSASAVVRAWLGAGVVARWPSGSDYSTDGGRTWRALPSRGFHTASAAPRSKAVWAAGEHGAAGSLRV
jgi:hypothetical protein